MLAGDGGPDGQTSDVVLASPIILYDHPAVAPESAGALFDSTEIDEILTLRVMTLTDEEKAQARATDPRAAAIIDRCEQMSPAGAAAAARRPARPARAARRDARPGDDLVGRRGRRRRVARRPTPSLVARRPGAPRAAWSGCARPGGPTRRTCSSPARTARVSAVHVDLDGETHVAVVLVDDPAADLHDWYGRYLYFAPDELEPLAGAGDRRPTRGEPVMRSRRKS